MTRFARAKGSKASNERLPEPATSWTEMKQDLLNKNKELAERKDREKVLEQRQANYQAFLQEKEEEEEKSINWASFSDGNVQNHKKNNPLKRRSSTFSENGKTSESSNKKLKTASNKAVEDDSDEEFAALKMQIDKVLEGRKKAPNPVAEDDTSDSEPPEEATIKEKPQEIKIGKAKKPKQKLKIVLDKEKQLLSLDSKENLKRPLKIEKTLSEKDKRLIEKKQARYKKQREKKILKNQKKIKNTKVVEDNSDQRGEENNNVNKTKLERKLARRQKEKENRKLKYLAKPEENNLSETALKKIEKKKKKLARQAEKRKKLKETKLQAAENDDPTTQKDVAQCHNAENRDKASTDKNLAPPPPKKVAKPRDKNQHPSRKPKPEVMLINGKNVEVAYIEGFPLKKDDAERIKNLRKEMISKGLPRSEIDAALKSERRRAEKIFAKERRTICFKCRKSGHVLSACPDLNKDQVADTAGTGICFKCGSTEHTHFECRAVKGMEYKFATCFICKEPGHIAKQCPDNQRGLYPNGGACKVCGDVTHLKKDCPKYQAQQAQMQNGLDIATWDNGNPEDFNGSRPNQLQTRGPRRANKIIKF